MCNPNANYWPGKQTRAGDNIELAGRDGAKFRSTSAVLKARRPSQPCSSSTTISIPRATTSTSPTSTPAPATWRPVPTCSRARESCQSRPTRQPAHGSVRSATTPPSRTSRSPWSTSAGEDLVGDLAITGFCWGGRLAYLFAARHPEVKLLIPLYGHLTAWTGADGNKPYSPLEEASKITARVVGSYGGGDDSIPLTDVSQMEERLKAAGRVAELKVYDGAPHCFFRTPEWETASQRRLGSGHERAQGNLGLEECPCDLPAATSSRSAPRRQRDWRLPGYPMPCSTPSPSRLLRIVERYRARRFPDPGEPIV